MCNSTFILDFQYVEGVLERGVGPLRGVCGIVLFKCVMWGSCGTCSLLNLHCVAKWCVPHNRALDGVDGIVYEPSGPHLLTCCFYSRPHKTSVFTAQANKYIKHKKKWIAVDTVYNILNNITYIGIPDSHRSLVNLSPCSTSFENVNFHFRVIGTSRGWDFLISLPVGVYDVAWFGMPRLG